MEFWGKFYNVKPPPAQMQSPPAELQSPPNENVLMMVLLTSQCVQHRHKVAICETSHRINIFWIGHQCREFIRSEAKCTAYMFLGELVPNFEVMHAQSYYEAF